MSTKLSGMLGTMVGTYRITGTIGQGGMGAVYAAEHTLLGRPAAVKVLLPELSQNQEIVTRFFNEAKAATAIRHPGIVEIYDFGWSQDGSAYIVMELLQGESLASRLARGRMGCAQALAVARQMAGALSAAHRKGIVHRDLKPDNAFLVPDPEVPGGERIKLLDFGIAKLAGDQSLSQKTRTGAVMGTPTYMAPEQCRGVAVDHRADLYSLGCILFEMISGQPPFVGEGVGDVLAAHIHVPPPALSTRTTDASPPIEHLVQRLLAKDPTLRFQTADEVVHAIDASGATSSYATPRLGTAPHPAVASMPTTLSGAAGSISPTTSRSRRGLVFACAAGGVVLILGIGFIVGRTRDAEDSSLEPVATPTRKEPKLATDSTAAHPSSAPAPTTPTPAPATPPAAPAAPTAAPTPAPAPASPAKVDVSITSVPSGAEVFMGGKLLGTTPLNRTLPHLDASETLTFRLAGYRDAQRTVRTDGDIKLSVRLDKKRAAATPATNDRDRGVNPFDN